jgi:hypothetical protein
MQIGLQFPTATTAAFDGIKNATFECRRTEDDHPRDAPSRTPGHGLLDVPD